MLDPRRMAFTVPEDRWIISSIEEQHLRVVPLALLVKPDAAKTILRDNDLARFEPEMIPVAVLPEELAVRIELRPLDVRSWQRDPLLLGPIHEGGHGLLLSDAFRAQKLERLIVELGHEQSSTLP